MEITSCFVIPRLRRFIFGAVAQPARAMTPASIRACSIFMKGRSESFTHLLPISIRPAASDSGSSARSRVGQLRGGVEPKQSGGRCGIPSPGSAGEAPGHGGDLWRIAAQESEGVSLRTGQICVPVVRA